MRDSQIKSAQHSEHFPDSFHRVVIKGLYVRDGKLLMCHDFDLVDKPPTWELPGGGLDFGESFAETLAREVKEEMGLTVTRVAEKPDYIWTHRKENLSGMEWWYSLHLAFRFDLKSLDDFTPTDECREINFFSKEELLAATDVNPQSRPFLELFNPADFT